MAARAGHFRLAMDVMATRAGLRLHRVRCCVRVRTDALGFPGDELLNGAYRWAGLATRVMWRRLGERLPKVARSSAFQIVRILLVFHLIAISWVFFRAKTIGDAVTIISKIAANLAEIPILIVQYPFSPEHGLGAALIALLLCVESLDERRPIAKRLAASPVALRWGAYHSVMFGLLILGQWQSKEFIYMQF